MIAGESTRRGPAALLLTALACVLVLVSPSSKAFARAYGEPEGSLTQASAPPGAVLHSTGRAVDGPYIVRTRFYAGDDVSSLQGIWLAGLASDADSPPRALAVTWTQVPSGWFGPAWTVHIASAGGLFPQGASSTPGTGFLDGFRVVQLATTQPRAGRHYETTLSYDPASGFASVRIVETASGQAIVERGLQLSPNAEALVPAAGFSKTVGGAAGPAGGSRFEAFDYERGFLPLGLTWSIQQRPPAGESWFRPQLVDRSPSLDRRLETRAEVRLPWDGLPGRFVLSAAKDPGTGPGDGPAVVLAEVPAGARQLLIPFDITRLPAGEHRFALAYANEYGSWDVLEQRAAVGRLSLRFEDLHAAVSNSDGRPVARVSGTLAVESDGPAAEASLQLLADVAAFDREYWITSAVNGSVAHGALELAPGASELVIIGNLALGPDGLSGAIPFSAEVPLDGAAPPPGGGWRITLRPLARADVPVAVPETESIWARAAEEAAEETGQAAGRGDAAARARELTVMVYNIRHAEGVDGAIDLERIAGVIREARPDIVALNEVDRLTTRTGRVDQAAELARMLGMNAAFGANLLYQGGEYGNAILSRFPIVAATNLALPSGNEQRGLLHATLDVGGEQLHVLATHLGLSDDERVRQLQSIAWYVGGLDDPVILAGDFNMEFGVESALGPRLRDTWRLRNEEGRTRLPRTGLTFPSTRPTRRIDFILISEGIGLRGDDPVRTIPSPASDHLPVVADLELER